MAWTPPTLSVKVALQLGPRDIPSDADWTDLSDRVKLPARCSRGRSDERAQFQPGTFSVELDNSDRMLDPANTAGLLYDGADRIGMPLCPVKVDWIIDGDPYRQFTGYLGPTCWKTTSSPRTDRSTVLLEAVDEMGYSLDLPSDAWGAMTAALWPDWWLRMDGGFPILGDSPDPSSIIPNRAGPGSGAFVVSPSGITRYVQPENSGTTSPALRLVTDNLVVSNANDIMPDGDEINLTFWLHWAATAAVPTGETAYVAVMAAAGGGNRRLEVTVGDDGEATVTQYDATESVIDTAQIDRTGSVISRFDDGESHMLIVRYSSGNNLDVWFGGCSPVGGTMTANAMVLESDLVLGANPVDVVIDEVTLWRKALTDDDIAGVMLAGSESGAKAWHGDTWADRLGHWYYACRRDVLVDDTDEWHMPSPVDEDDGRLFGLGAVNISIPANLAQAVQETAEQAGGAAWVTKGGYWRARSLEALTDTDYADDYATVSAELTDDSAADPEADPPEYRHAGVEPVGRTIDTVTNRVEMTFWIRADPPSDVSPVVFTPAPQDDESIARYGYRNETFDRSQWWGWAGNMTVADTMLDRYAQPYDSVRTVTLDVADDDLLLWLADGCELEKAVGVTYTPFGEDPVRYELNIQAVDWTLDQFRLTADLTVAKS